MKAFKIFFLTVIALTLLFDLAFATFALTDYSLAEAGKVSPSDAVTTLCYVAIAVNAVCVATIPVYFYVKKRSFFEN